MLGVMFLVAGCEESHLRLAPDFGTAVRQDQAAAIADPDAHYLGVLPAGYDGARTTIAVTRYRTDKVIPPVSTQTSDVGAGAGATAPGGPAGAPQ
jgi:hypothetical protein